MTKAAARDLGQSALAAFRADIPVGGSQPTQATNDILTVATLLRQATVAPASAPSRRMVREAARIAKPVVGKRRLQQGCSFDIPGNESPFDVFRMLGDRCAANGQVHLEHHILESVERLVPAGSLTAGRVRSRRLRLPWDLGELDLAQMQNAALFRGAQASPFDEVRLRVGLNLSAIAYTRGNLPASRRLARRVLRECGDRYPQIAAVAWTNLAVTAARGRQFDKALDCSWKAYGLAAGANRDVEEMILNNICQILLESGQPAAARAGFARLLSDSPGMRTAASLLGGFASASGALGDGESVTWAAGQVLRLAKLRSHPYELADSLLECSVAFAAVGQDARAGTMRRRSLRLAERHGFHDLIFKAQPTMIRSFPATSPLTGAGKEIAARVAEMEPDSMPPELVYAD
jgi:hypothetical protein